MKSGTVPSSGGISESTGTSSSSRPRPPQVFSSRIKLIFGGSFGSEQNSQLLEQCSQATVFAASRRQRRALSFAHLRDTRDMSSRRARDLIQRRTPMAKWLVILLLTPVVSVAAQTNPLWHGEKVKNYLPDMTWPEVESLLSRNDMVIIPVTAIEQHGPQLPIGTDYYSGEELAKLIAQKADILVAP